MVRLLELEGIWGLAAGLRRHAVDTDELGIVKEDITRSFLVAKGSYSSEIGDRIATGLYD